jgi:putative transposase
MPRIDFIFSQLGNAKVFTTIDLPQAYHQIEMNPDEREKTAFVTPHRGTFRHKRKPFRLKGAGFPLKSVMDRALTGLSYNCCLAFLDDVLIYSNSSQEYAEHLRQIFKRLSAAGFTVHLNKFTSDNNELSCLVT